MPKIMQNMKKGFLITGLWLVAGMIWSAPFHQKVSENMRISPVYADDENGYENEGSGDDNYSTATTDTGSTSSGSTKTKSTPTYKTVYVTKVITTLDPKFTTDTDKDGIVDGLDPHPTIPESEFFTDDDNDGVPNAFDLHPGEDDYAYFEQDQDANGNGILDSFESLGSH